ncbi:TPA: hypothetical protein ACGO07_001056 [Streptococcus suis]
MKNLKYLDMIITGTRLLTMSDFYTHYDELKSSTKDKLPLFLYSFNFVDRFEFAKIEDSNTTVVIKNISQGTHTKLNIGEYLLQNVIYQKDIFELKNIVDSDLKVEVSEKELTIYAAGELKECFTKLYENKSDVECAVKELICENLFICGIKFFQIADCIIDWTDSDSIVSAFLKMDPKVTDEITQDYKDLLCESLRLVIKSMPRSPSRGKFGVDIIKAFLLSTFFQEHTDIDEDIKEKIVDAFITNQENRLVDRNEELFEKFYANVYLEQFYDRIYTVKNSDNDQLLEFELLKIHIWEILGFKKFSKYIEDDKFNTLILENLYIGQSFGKNGERNVFDRIGEGHEKLQRIMATAPSNKGVGILFFSITPKGNLFISEYGSEAAERLKNLLDDNIAPKEYVDLAEVALITYFRPNYNTQHVKDDFKSLKTKKIMDIINSNDGILIFMDFEEVKWEINSNNGENQFNSNKPYIHCLFNKEAFNIDVKKLEDLFQTYSRDST